MDVHKRIVAVAILDAEGRLVRRTRFACTRAELLGFAASLEPGDRVALEATTNTWGVVGVLREAGLEVVVSNPLRTKAIADAKVKTDKVDAVVLAQLLRCDYLPQVWTPDARTLELRRLTAERAGVVAERTRLKNRIHAVLHQRLIEAPKGELFGKAGMMFLRHLAGDPALDELGRAALTRALRLLAAVEAEIADVTRTLAERAQQDPRAKLLMTLPGVDYGVAQTLLAVFGEVGRFRDGDHAAAYLGLVPSTHQSAERCYHGPITKQGRGHARWMLVQAAQHLARHPGPLGVFFRRLAKKKNRNVAVVAVARKLAVIAWHMLRDNQPYRYAEPRRTQDKLGRLRLLGGGRRRRGGLPKGTPRPPAYGSGVRTRAVPPLDEVLAREGLPALTPPCPGEERAVAQAGVAAFVAALHQPRRIPRRRQPRTAEAQGLPACASAAGGSAPDPAQGLRPCTPPEAPPPDPRQGPRPCTPPGAPPPDPLAAPHRGNTN